MFDSLKRIGKTTLSWIWKKTYDLLYHVFDSTWFGMACIFGVPYFRFHQDQYADYYTPPQRRRPASYYRALSTRATAGSIADPNEVPDVEGGMDVDPVEPVEVIMPPDGQEGTPILEFVGSLPHEPVRPPAPNIRLRVEKY